MNYYPNYYLKPTFYGWQTNRQPSLLIDPFNWQQELQITFVRGTAGEKPDYINMFTQLIPDL